MEGWSAFVFTAGGIAIGWLFNQLSSWWSVRGQRQRVYRRMLFFLLQLEWLFERMDVSEYVDHYIIRVKEQTGPEQMPPVIEKIMKERITAPLLQEAIKLSSAELAKLETGYTSAVTELSYIAPFIAFKLEGRTSIPARLDGAKEIIERVAGEHEGVLSSIMDELDVDPTTREEIKALSEQMIEPQARAIHEVLADMQPELLEEDLEEIRNLMSSISIRIGLFTWWRTVRGYREHGQLSKEEKEEMNDLIDDLVVRLKASVP